MKRKVTKHDLVKYPELKENHVREGDEYDFPDEDENDNDDFENNEGDTGGSNPPPNKGRG